MTVLFLVSGKRCNPQSQTLFGKKVGSIFWLSDNSTAHLQASNSQNTIYSS